VVDCDMYLAFTLPPFDMGVAYLVLFGVIQSSPTWELQQMVIYRYMCVFVDAISCQAGGIPYSFREGWSIVYLTKLTQLIAMYYCPLPRFGKPLPRLPPR
jgi:hypothetical protein